MNNVKQLRLLLTKYSELPDLLIKTLIVDCALQKLNLNFRDCLKHYLINTLPMQNKYFKIINQLISNDDLLNTYQTYYNCFKFKWKEDIGYLYLSLKNNSKNIGAYYTNDDLARSNVSNIIINNSMKFSTILCKNNSIHIYIFFYYFHKYIFIG